MLLGWLAVFLVSSFKLQGTESGTSSSWPRAHFRSGPAKSPPQDSTHMLVCFTDSELGLRGLLSWGQLTGQVEPSPGFYLSSDQLAALSAATTWGSHSFLQGPWELKEEGLPRMQMPNLPRVLLLETVTGKGSQKAGWMEVQGLEQHSPRGTPGRHRVHGRPRMRGNNTHRSLLLLSSTMLGKSLCVSEPQVS